MRSTINISGKQSRASHVISIFVLLASSCNSYVEKHPTAAEPKLTNSAPTIAYLQVKEALFAPSCIRCHGDGRAAGGVSLDSYAGAMAHVTAGSAASSRVVRVIRNGSMPPNGASAPDKTVVDLLEKWINEGAVEFISDSAKSGDAAASPEPAPTLPPVATSAPQVPSEENLPIVHTTFSEVSAKILEPHCLTCHAGEYAAAAVDLSDYASVLASNADGSLLKAGSPEESQLYLVLTDGFMPMGSSPVSAELIDVMKDWIQNGANQ